MFCSLILVVLAVRIYRYYDSKGNTVIELLVCTVCISHIREVIISVQSPF